MTKTIITAGKGGVGKTTLLYHLLNRHILPRSGRTLIVDADPHQSLASLLGAGQVVTLGNMRHAHAEPLRTGVGLGETTSRREYALQLTRSALRRLTENANLLVMGRNDQPGCQCVVNGLLGDALDALAEQYNLVIVDNEAGIEHIGRHGWPVDVALLITGMHPLELDVTRRIMRHAAETNRVVRNWGVIINSRHDAHSDGGEQILSLIKHPGAVVLGSLPPFDGLEPSPAWFEALDVIWRRIAYFLLEDSCVPAMVSRPQYVD